MVKSQYLVRSVKEVMERNGIKYHPATGVGYSSSYQNSLYDWELFFDAIALAYFGGEQFAINGIRMFLREVDENGFVCRRIHFVEASENLPDDVCRIMEMESEEHCKPFLFQTVLTICRMRGDASWIGREDYDSLKRYIHYWVNRNDRDRNGLSEWNSGPHSGADSQLERIGTWRSCFCEGTDLNCFLYREFLAAEEIALALGKMEDAKMFRDEANRKKERVQDLLWNEEEGFYYDRDFRTGEPIRVKTGATFLPLWAGISTPEQAETLVEKHLKNPEEFWTPFPIPSYARSEPGYTQRFLPKDGDRVFTLGPDHANWCGGMWPHWNYLIVHGLRDYGFMEEANHIAQRFFEAVSSPKGLYEWYNAETGEGKGVNPFWAGASILGAILPAELQFHFDPLEVEPVNKPLRFDAIRERLGLDGLFHPPGPASQGESR